MVNPEAAGLAIADVATAEAEATLEAELAAAAEPGETETAAVDGEAETAAVDGEAEAATAELAGAAEGALTVDPQPASARVRSSGNDERAANMG
ncbi:MAG: hypothetical protein JOZ39_13260 [Chloroflexi bacterium]|nr:hypothetical protein [Chloroflexota bacterium]